MAPDDIKNMAVQAIRRELTDNQVRIDRIILFGSRVHGNADRDSDWDFLVSTVEDVPFRRKVKLVAAIQRYMAEQHIAVDIILKSKSAVERDAGNVGVVTHYALKDGIVVS